MSINKKEAVKSFSTENRMRKILRHMKAHPLDSQTEGAIKTLKPRRNAPKSKLGWTNVAFSGIASKARKEIIGKSNNVKFAKILKIGKKVLNDMKYSKNSTF